MFTTLLTLGTLGTISAATVGEALIGIGTVCTATQAIVDAVEDL